MYPASRRPVEAPENVHERRLAGAGWTRYRDELARLNVDADAAQRTDLDLTDDVGFGEIRDADDCHQWHSAQQSAIEADYLR